MAQHAATARWIPALLLVLAATGGAYASDGADPTFQAEIRPFLQKHCIRCHNADEPTSGVRVDQLGAEVEDRQIKLWDSLRRQVSKEAMPPEDEPQPTAQEREKFAGWIAKTLDVARSKPRPKNGSIRRLTVAQYRNTLRGLLLLEDELTEILPPDAVSKDGFLNNQDTLALSPLLIEAYLEIAEQALDRSIVDPRTVPKIQRFRMDMGTGINPKPCPDTLILGANNVLLDNRDVLVTEPRPEKPFAFDHAKMRVKYRFIEGYDGNNTVRGWREYDSIYHSVFACLRGAVGYPKGFATNTVPKGLLLRPSITSDEIFEGDATYGPKANFKVSLRELPDHGKFRVTVAAAKYRDGLLLDPGTKSAPAEDRAVVVRDPKSSQTVAISRPGIYQVDIHPVSREPGPVTIKADRLSDALSTSWPLKGELLGDATFADSPLGKTLKLVGYGDSLSVPASDEMNVGTGDFTVAAWIHPSELRQSGIVSLGKYGFAQGWVLDMPNSKGVLRIETAGPDKKRNGTIQTAPETIRANAWQHVAAIVRRGKGQAKLFVNGEDVATGTINGADLTNPILPLSIGRVPDSTPFRGQIGDVRLYRRALEPDEIQALVEPGRKLIPPPVQDAPQDVTLHLGDRQFAAKWQQAAFVVARLDAGEYLIHVKDTGPARLDRVVLTPVVEDSDLGLRFLAFEKRSPRLGVHLGLRRDCGSTLNPVGVPQTVKSETPAAFVFEGAIRNFPSPEVESDNVNYLAGIREIGVRSEITDGRDMPRLLLKSVEFEGPYYDIWPPASHRNIFIDSPAKEDRNAYAREVLRRFASRAFRRPIDAMEEASILGVYDSAVKSGAPFERAIKDALLVVLTSPQFLFLIESSETPAPEPINDFELASKLSYFLWNSPPDGTTLGFASQGRLRESLDGEVTRLIADPKFERFVQPFAAQWLALEKFQVLEPDRKRFPTLTSDTRKQLRDEPIHFIQYLLRQNVSTRALIDSDFLVANEVVASYYGLADRTESGFDFVAIPHGRKDLGGVLSQAAILAGLSDGRESNPIKRGAWLARRIVAEPPDDPPPNVPALKDDTRNLTLRERLEKHRNQRGCQQCHAKIDPWGVALEEYDAGGQFKPQTVDARSTLPDQAKVVGTRGLKAHLADDRLDQVAFSVLKHLATYAAGRTLSQNELDTLKRDAARFKPNGYRMQDLLRYVVTSPIFLEK